MRDSDLRPPSFLDATTPVGVRSGRDLPHWSQAGTVAFITWRTWDSMPQSVVAGWVARRNGWLETHGIDPRDPDLSAVIRGLTAAQREEFRELLSERWECALDASHGSCPFRSPELASVVGDSLLHFDGERYTMHDFVVMPNHVHLLVSFAADEGMTDQCESWKHFTAVRLNRLLKRTGRFWHAESFDHLVRSAEWFEKYRRYIADNPVKAQLRPGEYLHYSRPTAGPT